MNGRTNKAKKRFCKSLPKKYEELLNLKFLKFKDLRTKMKPLKLALQNYFYMKKTTLLSIGLLFITYLSSAQDNTKKSIEDFQKKTKAKISINQNSGIPSFVKFPADKPLVLNGNKLKDKVDHFLATNKSIYAIENVKESLDSAVIKTDNYGLKHYIIKQYYKKVPVYDSELRFHFNKKEDLSSINGNIIPAIAIDPIPNIKRKEANAIALNLVKDQNINESGVPLKVITSTLYVYPKGLAKGAFTSTHLAYRIEVRNDLDVREYLFIDAHTGNLIEQFTGMAHVIHRSLYEVDYSNKVYSEGGSKESLNQWQKNEIETAGHVYNLFKNAFGYTSYDGADAEMITINNNPDIHCPNANWNGVTTNYCDEMAADDVVAHEWGHAYTEYTCNLIYAYESGALNEALSDMWGETVDLLNNYQDDLERTDIRNDCKSSDRWMIGEDVTASGIPVPLRDMWDPTCYGSPGKVTDPEYFCDPGFMDSGGVHYNSGIANHFYSLIVDGGTFNGQTLTGLGFVKAAHILWRAQSQYLTQISSFSLFADALEASCNDLIGINLEGLSTSETKAGLSGEIITATDYDQLVKAIAAVELRTEINCTYGTLLGPIDPLCDAASANPVFYENWETGIPSSWTVSQIPVNPSTWEAREWVIEKKLPKNRFGQGVFGPTPVNGDCKTDLQNGIIRLESPTITMPNYGNGDFELAFVHSIATEVEYDGGNLKYSLNGEPWIPIPSYAFTANPYNTVLSTENDNGNPMMGEKVFSGIDQNSYDYSEWGITVINLSVLGVTENSSIKLRWELGTDGCNGKTGWFIDDIAIYNCANALSVKNVDFLNDNVIIYPNPSSGIFNIKMKNLADFKFDIYDISGKEIMSKTNTSQNNTMLDLSKYAKGLYFIKITTDLGSTTKNLIVK